MRLLRSLSIFLAVLPALPALAHDRHAVHVVQAYARATVPGQHSGGAYLTLENAGTDADALIAAQSPAAQSVEIHTMTMRNNIMRMREVPAIDIRPGEKIAMRPGDGYHLMLMGLKKPLHPGDRLPLTLTFRRTGKMTVMLDIVNAMATGEMAAHAPPRP